MGSCSLPAQEPTLKHFSETATEMTLTQLTEEGVPFVVNAKIVRASGRQLLRPFDRAR